MDESTFGWLIEYSNSEKPGVMKKQLLLLEAVK